MDAILTPIQDAFEGQIVSQWCVYMAIKLCSRSAIQTGKYTDLISKDFHGQQLAESLSTILQIIFGVRLCQSDATLSPYPHSVLFLLFTISQTNRKMTKKKKLIAVLLIRPSHSSSATFNKISTWCYGSDLLGPLSRPLSSSHHGHFLTGILRSGSALRRGQLRKYLVERLGLLLMESRSDKYIWDFDDEEITKSKGEFYYIYDS